MLENILFSMNSTMPLFFIMLLGYVLHRTGFLSDAFVAGMCCSALRSHWRASL